MSILRFLDGKPKNGSLCVPAILARTTTLFPSWRMSSMVSFRSGRAVVSCARSGFTPAGPGGVPGAPGISTQSSCRIFSKERWNFLGKRLVPKRDGFFVSIHIFVLVSGVVLGIHERTGCEIEESKQIRFHRRKFRQHDVSSLTKAPPLSQTQAPFAPEEQHASQAARSRASIWRAAGPRHSSGM